MHANDLGSIAASRDRFRLKSLVTPTIFGGAPMWRMRSYFEMANWSDPWTNGAATASVGTRTASYDAGLRSYMLSVYN